MFFSFFEFFGDHNGHKKTGLSAFSVKKIRFYGLKIPESNKEIVFLTKMTGPSAFSGKK